MNIIFEDDQGMKKIHMGHSFLFNTFYPYNNKQKTKTEFETENRIWDLLRWFLMHKENIVIKVVYMSI